MATKQEIIDKLSQCGGLSYADWIKLLDSIYFDGDLGDVYEPVEGEVLPIPEGDFSKFSIVGQGTYTQANGYPIVVPNGYLGILDWDGTIWSLGNIVALPTGLNGSTNEPFDINRIGGYKSKDIIQEGSLTYKVKDTRVLEQGLKPSDYPQRVDVVWANILPITQSQLDSTRSPGKYRVIDSSSPYDIDVTETSTEVKQIRINPAVADSSITEPYVSYRTYNKSSSTWSGGFERADTIKIIKSADLDNIIKPDFYKVITSVGFFFLRVERISGTNIVRQIRTQTGSSSPVFLSFPYESYRDRDLTSSGNGGSYPSTWKDLRSFKVIDISNLDSTIEAGLYLVVTSSNCYPMRVAVSGNIVRQTRTDVNILGVPKDVYRDYNISSSTWGAEKQVSPLPRIEGNQTNIDALRTAGPYLIEQPSGNNYILYVAVSGTRVVQWRPEVNLAGSPRIISRESTTTVGAPWTINKTSLQKMPSSLNDDVMWSWWNYPLMIKTSLSQEKLHVSYTDSAGDTGVISHVIGTDQFSKCPIKENVVDIDDHNAGAIVRLSNGKLFTVFSESHNVNGRISGYISSGRETSTSWNKVLDITSESSSTTTYSQLLYINGIIYLFIRVRTSSANWKWQMIKSLDNGNTWGELKTVIYHATQQWYCIFRPCADDDNLIKIAHYSNPTLPGTAIRGAYINIQDDTVLDSDGSTVIGNIGQNNNAEDFEVLIAASGEYRNRLLDLKINNANQFDILYCTFTNENDGEYIHYKNGSNISITTSGAAFYIPSRYYGGAVFGEVNKVYLSKNSGINGNFSIEEWSINSEIYSKTDTLATSSKRLIRPIYNDGIIAWIEGYFNPVNFTEFSTKMSYKVINN